MENSLRSFEAHDNEKQGSSVFVPAFPDASAAVPAQGPVPREEREATGLSSIQVSGGGRAAGTAASSTARRVTPPPVTRRDGAHAASTTEVRVRQRRHRDPNAPASRTRRTSVDTDGLLRAEEEEAHIVAAEDESWTSWFSRKLYNGLLVMSMTLYQAVQAAVRQQQVDIKVIEFTNEQYWPNPPTRAELAQRRRDRRRQLGLPEEEELGEATGAEASPAMPAADTKNPLTPASV